MGLKAAASTGSSAQRGLGAPLTFDPGPLGVESIEHDSRSRAVGDVGRGEMDVQQAPGRVDGDVALAAHRLLASVVTALGPWRGRLDGLAVDDRSGGLDGTVRQGAIDHERDIVDRGEHQAPRQTSKLPVYGLPGREMDRQHAPCASRADQIADGVQDLAHVHPTRTAGTSRFRQKRLHGGPFLVREVASVAFGLLGNALVPSAALFRPYA